MRDLFHNVQILPLFPSQPLTGGGESKGPLVSLKGASSSVLIIYVGEASNDFDDRSKVVFILEHGEEGQPFAPVSQSHLLGGIVREGGQILTLDHADKTNRFYRYSYRGSASYLQLTIKAGGEYEKGTVVGAVLVQGGLSYAPVKEDL